MLERSKYDSDTAVRRTENGLSFLFMLGGVALLLAAEKVGLARYNDSNDVLEVVGAIIAIPAAAIFINKVTE